MKELNCVLHKYDKQICDLCVAYSKDHDGTVVRKATVKDANGIWGREEVIILCQLGLTSRPKRPCPHCHHMYSGNKCTTTGCKSNGGFGWSYL